MSFLHDARKVREERERKLRAVPDPEPDDPFDSPGPVDADEDPFDAPGSASEGAGNTSSSYAQKALQQEADAVRSAAEGTRNHALNKAAFSLGQLVAGGELTHDEVVAALTDAARQAGLDEREIGPTIRSGLSKGMLNPRTAPRTQILGGIYDTAEEAAASWEEPEPLEGEEPAKEEFPIGALPKRVALYVEAVAANTQTPTSMAGMLALATLSAAAVGRVWVHGGSGWVEPATVWTITALPPASRKSAVVKAIAGELYAIEREMQEAHRNAHVGKAERLEIAKKTRESLISKAAKADNKNERDDLAAQMDAVAKEIAECTVPEPPFLLLDDFTPESLGQVLQRNGGHAAALSAEGGVFSSISGRYQQGTPQLDLILKSYDGDSFRAHRVTRDPVIIDRPGLSLGLVVQPHILAETTKTPALRERGLMGRFAYALPEDTVGTRDVYSPEVPSELSDGWARALRAITNLPPCGDDQPLRIVQLHPDALELHRGFRRVLEPRLHPITGDLAFMADWAGKHAGRVLRIALLLHLAASHGTGSWISFDTMCSAVEIGEWMVGQAVAVYGGWRAPKVNIPAVRVLDWIRRTQPPQFVTRDAWQALRGQAWCVSADAVKDALVILAQAGWVTTVQRLMADGKRRCKEGWFIPHPDLLGGQP
ncbi:YfjI family protein [Nonomuraea sediminis]|uniref:YfjI family protein n=1 Tax=Nonomuraea sediminis TaxID=2835864 RepID=UPI001BDD2C20|nr:YfjI family protein [Nonomuraea sediminis]